MPLLAKLRNTLGYYKRVRDYGSVETARLIQRNLQNIVAPLRPEGSRMACDRLGLSLDPTRHGFFLEGMLHVSRLKGADVGRFETMPDGTIEFRLGSLRIIPETEQELFILDEVFREEIYDLKSRLDWLVWDIGMNVGIATAFFAGIKGWETVGYEPFPEPFALAKANIERSGLGSRVRLNQIGVSDRDETLRLAYDAKQRGSNGLYGNNALDQSGSKTEVEVRFEDAATILDALLNQAAGRPILAKIDCEGAEYAIIRRLRESGRLSLLDAIVMEYHILRPEHNPGILIDSLVEEGYVVRTQHQPNAPIGLLWATRVR